MGPYEPVFAFIIYYLVWPFIYLFFFFFTNVAGTVDGHNHNSAGAGASASAAVGSDATYGNSASGADKVPGAAGADYGHGAAGAGHGKSPMMVHTKTNYDDIFNVRVVLYRVVT